MKIFFGFVCLIIITIVSLFIYVIIPKKKNIKIEKNKNINPFCRNYKLSLYLDSNISYKKLSTFCYQRGIDLLLYKEIPSNIELNFTQLIPESNDYTMLYQIGELKEVNCGVPDFCTSETASDSTCSYLNLDRCINGENSGNCNTNCEKKCTIENLKNLTTLENKVDQIACKEACPKELGTTVCPEACTKDFSDCQSDCKVNLNICRDYSAQNCKNECVAACQNMNKVKFNELTCNLLCKPNCKGCYNCYHSIYYKFRNQPQKMLDAFSKFFPEKINSKIAVSAMCAHKVLSDSISSNAVQPFDSFGSWNWEEFQIFLDLLAEKYNLKEIRIDSWSTLPIAWIANPIYPVG